MTTIYSIRAREVLDSRGNPTVEAEVTLAGGTSAVPWFHREHRRGHSRRWSFEMAETASAVRA